MLNNFRFKEEDPNYQPLNLSIPTETNERYNYFRSFYDNEKTYNEIMRYAEITGNEFETLNGLVNPVYQSVAFFESRVLSNPVIVSTNAAVKDALDRVWKWSNLYGSKNSVKI